MYITPFCTMIQRKGLKCYDALSRRAFLTLDDFKLHLLPLGQGAKPLGPDRAVVDENIFAVFARDKSVALRVVEPLYGSQLAICHE